MDEPTPPWKTLDELRLSTQMWGCENVIVTTKYNECIPSLRMRILASTGGQLFRPSQTEEAAGVKSEAVWFHENLEHAGFHN